MSTRTVIGASRECGRRHDTSRRAVSDTAVKNQGRFDAILPQHRRHIGQSTETWNVTIAFRRQLSSAGPVLEQKRFLALSKRTAGD
jgi:hypothetical protein